MPKRGKSTVTSRAAKKKQGNRKRRSVDKCLDSTATTHSLTGSIAPAVTDCAVAAPAVTDCAVAAPAVLPVAVPDSARPDVTAAVLDPADAPLPLTASANVRDTTYAQVAAVDSLGATSSSRLVCPPPSLNRSSLGVGIQLPGVIDLDLITSSVHLITDDEISVCLMHAVCPLREGLAFVLPAVFSDMPSRVGEPVGDVQIAEYLRQDVPVDWKKLYVPVHYPGSVGHWALFIVDRQGQTARYCDSMRNPLSAVVKGKLTNLLNLLAHVHGTDKVHYSITCDLSLPTQQDGRSCGAWICRFAREDAQPLATHSHEKSDCCTRRLMRSYIRSVCRPLPGTSPAPSTARSSRDSSVESSSSMMRDTSPGWSVVSHRRTRNDSKVSDSSSAKPLAGSTPKRLPPTRKPLSTRLATKMLTPVTETSAENAPAVTPSERQQPTVSVVGVDSALPCKAAVNAVLRPNSDEAFVTDFIQHHVCTLSAGHTCLPHMLDTDNAANTTDLLSVVPRDWNTLYLPHKYSNGQWVLVILVNGHNPRAMYCDSSDGTISSELRDKFSSLLSCLSELHSTPPLKVKLRKPANVPVQQHKSTSREWVCRFALSHAQGVRFHLGGATDASTLQIVRERLDPTACADEVSAVRLTRQSSRASSRASSFGAVETMSTASVSSSRGTKRPAAPRCPTPVDGVSLATKTVGPPLPKRLKAKPRKQAVQKLLSKKWQRRMKIFTDTMDYIAKHIKECHICREKFPDLKFKHPNDSICKRCTDDRATPKMFSVDNNMHPSEVPEELKGLSVIEQMLIARAHPIFTVWCLVGGQRATRGQGIAYPQSIGEFAKQLPHTNLPVVLISKEENRKVKQFRVNRERVLRALLKLKEINPLYRDIDINEAALNTIPQDGYYKFPNVVPEGVEIPEELLLPVCGSQNGPEQNGEHDEIDIVTTFVPLIPTVETEKDKRARILAEALQLNWPTIDYSNPLDENENPIFTMCFPHLFPDGVGDFSRPRLTAVTLGEYVKHLLKYHDDRFRKDERFQFFSMNVIFRARSQGCGKAFLADNPGTKHLTAEELLTKLQNPNFLKKVLAYSGSLHGSQAYWWGQAANVEDMVRQLGPPTFFCTLSAADTFWPDLCDLFEANNLGDMHTKLRGDPAMADWYFTKRFETFLKDFFKDCLKCTDYYFRVEYQHRGSPHVHGIIWMPDAPNVMQYPVDTEDIQDYVDSFINTWNPLKDFNVSMTKADLYVPIHPSSKRLSENTDFLKVYCELVLTCMRHTKCQVDRCLVRRDGGLKCRFNFPQDLQPHTTVTAQWGETRTVPSAHEEVIGEADGGVDLDFSPEAVRQQKRFDGVNVKTARNDPLLAMHNPQMVVGFGSNCEMQLITSFFKLLRYLVKYMVKPEPKSTMLKKVVRDLANDSTACLQPEKLLYRLMMHTVIDRDMSAQECSHHLLGLPLYFCSRKFVVANINNLQQIGPKGTKSSIIDRYMKRHAQYENETLFDFVRKYSDSGKIGDVAGVRKQDAIVCLRPKFSSKSKQEKQREKHFQQQLMGHVVWRDDFNLLRQGFDKWHDAYKSAVDKGLIRQPTDVFALDQYVDVDNVLVPENEETSAPAPVKPPVTRREVDLRDTLIDTRKLRTYRVLLPPGEEQEDWMLGMMPPRNAEEGRVNTDNGFIEFVQDLNFDWDSEAEKVQCEDPEGFIQQHALAGKDTVRQFPEVSSDTLNEGQKAVFDIVHTHHMDRNTDKAPLRLLVLGVAGTGKSHLIHAIRTLLADKCIVLAPTGVAAWNIRGETVHSKLNIPVKEWQDLSSVSLEEKQSSMAQVEYVILDEISMVGQKLMGKVNGRLNQIFPPPNPNVDWIMGNRSFIFLGDLGQLPPVKDTCLFAKAPPAGKDKYTLAPIGRAVYFSLERAFHLDTVVRQDSDEGFRDFLLRLHEGQVRPEDARMLESRTFWNAENAHEFKDAMVLYTTNSGVNNCNLKKLKNVGNVVAVIHAQHDVNRSESSKADADKAGGLVKVLPLCVDARVMLKVNLWVDAGLVNGSIGTVKAIVYEPGKRPPALPRVVYVHFPEFTGPTLEGGLVPICPVTTFWSASGNRSCSRKQLPLALAYAVTVHKSQGLTMERVVANLGSKPDFCPGLTYVALSRVRKLTDLMIDPQLLSKIMNAKSPKGFIERLQEERRLRRSPSEVVAASVT